MSEFFRKLWAQIKNVWENLNNSQRIAVIGVSAVVILSAVFVAYFGMRPSYGVLFSGLASEDAGTIITKLKEENVPYKVTGNSIEVPSNQVYDLRLRMAGQGLPESGNIGYELMDKSGFSQTEFSQKVNLKRALEGELARTISQIDEVKNARVHIVVPESKLFSEDQKETTASILLKLKQGTGLDESQVDGVVNLVSKSVEGLKSRDVVVVDTNGNILSDKSGKGVSGKLTMDQLQMKRSFESDIQRGLENMLAAVVGPQKSTVKVAADLDFTQKTTDSQIFEGPPIPVSEQTESEKLNSEGTTPGVGNVAGVASNIPGAVFQGQQENQVSDYKKTNTTINNEITKHNERKIEPPGKVNKLSVAILIDSQKGLLPTELNSIMMAANAAAGIDATRGDALVVQSVPFDTSMEAQEREEEQAERRSELYNTIVKAAILVLLVGLAVYAIRRMLDSQESFQLSPEFALPSPALPELEARTEFSLPTQDAEEAKRAQIYSHVEQMAKDKPDDVARLLERWLTAD